MSIRKQISYLLPFALLLQFTILSVANAQQAPPSDASFEIPDTDDGLAGDGPIRRYRWFRNLWKNRRSGWAKQVKQDQQALVFLGDSITQGWGPNMKNAFAGVKVANRGISGDTTRGMLLRLEEDVLSLNPTGVVMLMGTNDLEEGATPATIAANLKLIVAALKAHNREMPIVLCNVFPSSASKKRSATDIKEINRLYADAVKGDPQITVIDTWTLFANENGDAKEEEFPDLLHPNGKGYAKWAAALRPILATHDFLDRDVTPKPLEPGYVSLFNGRNLDGWMYRPSTEKDKKQSANWRKNNPAAPPWPILTEAKKFDGETSTNDGRYIAKNGRLVVTTPAEGRRIQQFWTQQEFPKDFILKLEFRATPNADSGIFLRGKQLQCRDFTLAGPYKTLKNYRPQDWNEIVVSVKGQSAWCACNGEVIEADFQIPKTGPIGLEGDRGQIEYRNIRLKEINSELPRSTPEQHGVSSAAILNLVNAFDEHDSVHSFMLLRHGNVLAEGWWAPFERNDPHQLYSLSKSFTSTAVGLAIAEGKMSLDDKVMSFFPDESPSEPTWQLSAMRVRDLLTMSTGHVSAELNKFSFQSDSVLTKDFLELPIDHSPGTHFLYNTPATYMCSAIVQKVTGEKLIDYLQPRLFEPLGIEGATWSESAQGVAHGGFGLNVRTEDIARLGQLYLQNGEWQGRQIVPRDWAAMATMKQTSNGSNPDNDWNQGYGFQFWRCRHNAYRGDGAFGQFCIVIPDHDLVLAVTSGSKNMGAIMQHTWDHLLPGIHQDALRRNAKAHKQLQERIQQLSLPLVEGEKRSSTLEGEHAFAIADNDNGVSSIDYNFGDKPKLTIRDADGEYQIPIATDGWVRMRLDSIGPLGQRVPNADTVAVATHSAWQDANSLHTRIWLYESPYRIDLMSKFDGDTVEVEMKQNVGFGPKGFQLKGSAR